jgi:pimeloyl-ACP methyl ester carboxylesterase
VLLIYGERDALVRAKPSIARAAALNPRMRSKLYADSGHAPFMEEPDRFNHDLSDFIDTTVPPRVGSAPSVSSQPILPSLPF